MKRAIVIGASQNMGSYLAAELAEQGWMVTGIGRRPFEELTITQHIDYIQADLADPNAFETLSKYFKEATPDLIVHNAVTYGESANFIPTLDELERVFRVNALMPYRLILQYLSTAPEDRFCSCIVVNSDSIYHANQHSGVYAASKAALRVLTTALADVCQSRNASVSTLLLGPLADLKKMADFSNIAKRRDLSEEEVIRAFLKRSNPSFVIDSLIDFESCVQSILYISRLGRIANGMVCKLDGGSSGSLI